MLSIVFHVILSRKCTTGHVLVAARGQKKKKTLGNEAGISPCLEELLQPGTLDHTSIKTT